jgi:hypothetical protein
VAALNLKQTGGQQLGVRDVKAALLFLLDPCESSLSCSIEKVADGLRM